MKHSFCDTDFAILAAYVFCINAHQCRSRKMVQGISSSWYKTYSPLNYNKERQRPTTSCCKREKVELTWTLNSDRRKRAVDAGCVCAALSPHEPSDPPQSALTPLLTPSHLPSTSPPHVFPHYHHSPSSISQDVQAQSQSRRWHLSRSRIPSHSPLGPFTLHNHLRPRRHHR